MAAMDASAMRIPRPALSQRLARGLAQGNLVLTAEAGFGKTWAIQEALALREARAGWIHCSSDDCDPGRLLLSLIHALRGPLGDAATTLSRDLASGTGVVDPLRATRDLLRALAGLLVEPVVLVVDDAEALADSPEALAVVGELVAFDDGTVRVAVASRRPLGLRLAKLRLAGRVTEVGHDALVFDAGECAALMWQRTGNEPEPEAVEALMLATGGWPLGIALALRADGTQLGGADSREELFAFLAEEVLDGLAPELRAALLDAALARAVDPVVSAALGLPGDLLGRLRASGVLVMASEAGSFSFHPLFRDFLLERRGAERSSNATAGAHGRLAKALATAGRPLEAVEHWLAAGAWDAALDALVSENELLVRTAPAIVRRWLARVPSSALSHPQARLLEGRLAHLDGRHEDAVDLLRTAVNGFADQGNEAAEWSARRALAQALTSLPTPFDELSALAEGFEQVDYPAAPAVAMTAALQLTEAGRTAESDALAARVLRHPHGAPQQAIDRQRRAIALFATGRVPEAISQLHEADALLEHDDVLGEHSEVCYTLGAAYEQAGWPELALEAYQRSLRFAQDEGIRGPIDELRAEISLLHLRAGRLDEAAAEIARTEAGSHAGWTRVVECLIRSRLAGRRGADSVRAELTEALAPIGDMPFTAQMVTVARIAPELVREGMEKEARGLLADALEYSEKAASSDFGAFLRAHVEALDAWLRHNAGEPYGEALARAFASAGDAIPHLLRVERERLLPMVRSALTEGHLEVLPVIRAIRNAWPSGEVSLQLTDHPSAEVRGAAIVDAVRSGRPEALRRAETMRRDHVPEVALAAADALARAQAAPLPLEIRVLGGFSFGRGGWVAGDADWGRPLAARLVRYLLVHLGEGVPEDDMFEAFWGGKDAVSARRALHVNLSLARGLLDAGATVSAIVASGRVYRLQLRLEDTVDAQRFEALARKALGESGRARLRLLHDADRAWTGEPLPEERYADWAASWRERLINLHLEVLGELVAARRIAGDTTGCIEAARRLVSADPVDESAHRELIAAYARAGRRGQALRQYLECRRALVDELGVEPARETTELQSRVLAGAPT